VPRRAQLKNQVQASTAGVRADAGWAERAKWVLANRGGVVGLYRGIGPGEDGVVVEGRLTRCAGCAVVCRL